MNDVASRLKSLQDNVERVIRGKTDSVRLLLVGLLARGHALIEDIPGVGKTTLARALAQSISCTFRRIQLTSDMLPSDVLGVAIYNPETDAFRFKPGPVFANIVLADELNRTPPRTQSSLLEAMNDGQVSLDSQTHALPNPFLVIATLNPLEHAGTYPLPDSQLDRFLLSFEMGYPDTNAELEMLRDQNGTSPLDSVKPVFGLPDLLELQKASSAIRVSDDLDKYIVRVIQTTRSEDSVALGASPRASIGLRRAAQASALLSGRDHVRPDDVKSLAVPVLAHRIIPREGFGAGQRKQRVELVKRLLDRTPVPV